jgi:penicillin-binding protein-related factor A (putative recombinase)
MGWVWRVNSGVLTQQSGGKTRHIRMAQKGTSDIIGMIKTGQFVALEVKLPGKEKTITEAQKTFLEKVAANGGIASMVTSCDEALALIKSLNVYDSMK